MKISLLLLFCLISFHTNASPPSSRSSNIQLLHGKPYELGANTRESITVEHATSRRFGESYFFPIFFNRHDVDTVFYAKSYSRLSWNDLINSLTCCSNK